MQDPEWTGHMPMEPALLITSAVLEELLGPAEGGSLHKAMSTRRRRVIKSNLGCALPHPISLFLF